MTVPANPLFVSWVEDMYKEALQHDSKIKYSIKKALESIKTYPIVIDNPKDCLKLLGLGPKLVKRLEVKLESHYEEFPALRPPPSPIDTISLNTAQGSMLSYLLYIKPCSLRPLHVMA